VEIHQLYITAVRSIFYASWAKYPSSVLLLLEIPLKSQRKMTSHETTSILKEFTWHGCLVHHQIKN